MSEFINSVGDLLAFLSISILIGIGLEVEEFALSLAFGIAGAVIFFGYVDWVRKTAKPKKKVAK